MDISDPKINTILQLNNELDPNDPDDVATQTRVLDKMTREHKKEFDEMISDKVWNIHDEQGKLVPHIFKDGIFQKVDPPPEENSESIYQ